MMSEQEITETLTQIGFKESEIPTVLHDVGVIIVGNVLAAYLPMFLESERIKIASLSSEELRNYLTEHAGSLPPFPQAQFDAIHDEAWRDYFSSIK